jgi:hypothetical protein
MILGKILTSKFLLNHLVQISKALVYSKNQFLIKKDFFQLSAQSAQLPAGPSGPSFHTAYPAVIFLLLHRSRARKPPPPAGLALPPRSSLTTSTEGKITAASLLLHFPIKQHPPPSSIPGNRCLQSGGIEAPSTPAIEGTRPPPPHLHPIKHRPALGEEPHNFSAPSLSPHRALTATLSS